MHHIHITHSQCPEFDSIDLFHGIRHSGPEKRKLFKSVVEGERCAIFEAEDEEYDWTHHIFLCNVRDGEFDPVINTTNLPWMEQLICLHYNFLRVVNWFFVVGDEEVVIDAFVKV